jgi:predicted CXXCH cytochrome family protein
MLRMLTLGVLLLYPVLLQAQDDSIHRQAYDCQQRFSDGCDEVCLRCHEGPPPRENSADQLWNPAPLWADDQQVELQWLLPEEESENFWVTLPYEHRACRECHEDHVGAGNHPMGRTSQADNWHLEEGEDSGGVRYFDGLLLCATCHEPHSREKHLLRIDNQGSRLCLFCHNK